MDKVPESPPKTPALSENPTSECTTPTQDKATDKGSQGSGIDLRKTGTPDRLKVPKSFKYPERYTSPTDMLVSPVTKNLLARNRKGGALLPPSKSQTKIQDLRVQDCGSLPELKC